jgi:beta-galactosidase
LRWTVPYQPGTLRAVGYKDGNAVANEEIITSGLPVSISLAPDKSQIRANQRDVVHVTVQLLDAQGRVVPTADQEINFAVEGAGRLIGLDNGDPASHEYFKGNRRKLYHGLALALIQSTAFSGKITLTASSPGLLPGNLVIEVI